MSDEGRGSAYETADGVQPARIVAYPRRRPSSTGARLAITATASRLRYEDFFVPPLSWDELHRRTERWLDDERRRDR